MKYRVIRNGFEHLGGSNSLAIARAQMRDMVATMATILRGRYPGREVREEGNTRSAYLSVYTTDGALLQREFFVIEEGTP